jgi:hypothetical protein
LREYNLKYLGLIGNVFHVKDIDAAIEKGKHLDNLSNSYTQKPVGPDPGFGSSAFGVCITELVDGVVNVLHAEEYPRPDFDEMIEVVASLLDKYEITFENQCRIFVDGANPAFIRALKERVDDNPPEYEQFMVNLKQSYGPSFFNLKSLMHDLMVVPVNFRQEHMNMLIRCKELLEYADRRGVAIDESRVGTKLTTALRTAEEDGEGVLDKEATSHDDLMDAFRMSLMFWH